MPISVLCSIESQVYSYQCPYIVLIYRGLSICLVSVFTNPLYELMTMLLFLSGQYSPTKVLLASNGMFVKSRRTSEQVRVGKFGTTFVANTMMPLPAITGFFYSSYTFLSLFSQGTANRHILDISRVTWHNFIFCTISKSILLLLYNSAQNLIKHL